MNTNTLPRETPPWWRIPMVWLIIVLPMSAVVGSLTTWWIASQKFDGLVSEEYYKEGMAIHQVFERDAQARAMHLSARIQASGDRLALHLESAGTPVFARELKLSIVHPTQSGQDHELTLQADADGVYTATLPPLREARRTLVLEPADRAWRLTGQWQAPFTGERILRPIQE